LQRREARRALLGHSVMVVDATFTPHAELLVPLHLSGNESRLRYLALDVRTTPFDGAYDPVVTRGLHSMASM
jgi:hypothetical protein